MEGDPFAPASAFASAVSSEDKRRWDLSFQAQKQQISNQKYQTDTQYKIAKLQAANAAESNEIDRWYKGEQVKLATQAHELAVRKQTFDEGFSIVNLGAQLSSTPQDFFKLAEVQRGLPYLQGAPQALQALASNQAIKPYGPQPAGANIQSQTLGGLVQALTNAATGGPGAAASTQTVGTTGIPSTGNPAGDATLSLAQQIAQQGMHKLAPGSLESLDPIESGLLQGAWARGGQYVPSLLSAYDASRPGQGNPWAA